MSLGRVYAIILRYLYGIPHDVPRLFDIFFWPLIDLFVWGFLTVYLTQARGGGYVALSWLIGGIIFWTVLYRASQDVAVQLLEDIWARNFLNLFASPLRLAEFVTALLTVTLLKLAVTFAIISAIAYVAYAFDVFTLGLYLVPFVGVLLLFGWAMGLVVAALIVRYGSRVQIFAWGAAFLVQPISAIFYPVDVLPAALIPLARANPATYVFEGMRAVLLEGSFPADQWLLALALAGLTLALSIWLFVLLFDQARARGMLARLD
jgi:ABC-2 type transport system permease protein